MGDYGIYSYYVSASSGKLAFVSVHERAYGEKNMCKNKILDCTLRDGGYVNDWKFGKEAIRDICKKSEKMGADIIELGFMRDIVYNEEIAMYSSTEEAERILPDRNRDLLYAVMTEMSSYYPYQKIMPRSEKTFDMIRHVFWKRNLTEAVEYGRKIKEKGYELAIQPTRVEQYNIQEFTEMIRRFNEIHPYAVYIVDTFGLLSRDQLLKYAEAADKALCRDSLLGYHAHNNMQQAFNNAAALTELGLDRGLCIDVSMFGMGRGAGNLNAEVYLNYLNETYGAGYDIAQIYQAWDMWLKDIYQDHKWGYSLYYFIGAHYRANPNFAAYMSEHGVSVSEMDKIMKSIPYEERIVFDEDKIKKYLEK